MVRFGPYQEIVSALVNSYIHGLNMSFTSLVAFMKSFKAQRKCPESITCALEGKGVSVTQGGMLSGNNPP